MMNFQNESEVESLFEAVQSKEGSNRSQQKQKKIKKDKNIRSRTKHIETNVFIDDVNDLMQHQGEKYFGRSKIEINEHIRGYVKTCVHIKDILGLQSNVYSVKNFEKCQNDATNYFRLISSLEGLKLCQVDISSLQYKLKLECGVPKKSADKKRKAGMVLLNKNEYLLLKKRKNMLKEIDVFLQKITQSCKQNKNMDFLTKQILALCKLNTNQQNEIIENIQEELQKNDEPFQSVDSTNQDQTADQYIKYLIQKNLLKGLDDSPIELINYFKIVENTQKNIHDDVPLKRLCNSNDLKEYLKSRRPKLGKSQQQCLKTCCSACFSNYYELYNPIQVCSDCGMRMHKYCHQIRTKCQRCKYIRKTQQEKNLVHFCVLCERSNQKGLMIQSINYEGKEQYAHTFCLLAHNLWTVSKGLLKEDIANKKQKSVCRQCRKDTYFYLNCSDGSHVHAMCAFLSGHSFKSEDNGFLYIQLNDGNQQERISFQRKFRLNFQKMLYKANNQFFSLIQRV